MREDDMQMMSWHGRKLDDLERELAKWVRMKKPGNGYKFGEE